MQVLRISWRVLKALRTFLLVSFLLLSVALNVSIFFGGMLYSMASGVVESATGVKSLATRQKTKIADLDREVASNRSQLAKSRQAQRRLSDRLSAERAVSRKLKMEAAQVSGAVLATSARVHKRSADSAKRSLKTAALKAAPYFGVAAVATVTAAEFHDLCETLKDLEELKKTIGAKTEPETDTKELCGQTLPTKESLLLAVKSSPREAWEAAKEVTPSLQDLTETATWLGESLSDAASGVGEGAIEAYRWTGCMIFEWCDWIFEDLEQLPDPVQ